MKSTSSVPPLASRIASASIASGASFAWAFLQSILMVPLLLAVWSAEEYGQWIVVTTIFGVLTTIDFGLHNFVGNLFSMATSDEAQIRRCLGSGIRAAFITASGLVFVGGVYSIMRGSLGDWMPISAPDEPIIAAISILAIYWIAFGSVGGIAVRLYQAHGLMSRLLWLSLLQRLTMTAVLICAVWCGAGLVSATLAWALAGTAINALIMWDVRTRFSRYNPWLGEGSWREAAHLVGGASGLIAVSMLDSVGLAVIVSLTDQWASAVAVASFGAVRTAANAVMQGSAVILTPLAPDLSRFAAIRDGSRASAMLASAWLLATGPIALASAAALPIVEAGFKHWTRGTLTFPPVLFGTLIAAVLVKQWVSPLAMLLFCTNSIRPQFLVSLCRCAAVITTAMLLFQSIGIAGMGIAILIGEAVAAAGIVAATSIAFSEICDRRCIRGAMLAMFQVIASIAAIAAWWWMPSLRWQVWIATLSLQATVMTAQWLNLHPAARDRIGALFPTLPRGDAINGTSVARVRNGGDEYHGDNTREKR